MTTGHRRFYRCGAADWLRSLNRARSDASVAEPGPAGREQVTFESTDPSSRVGRGATPGASVRTGAAAVGSVGVGRAVMLTGACGSGWIGLGKQDQG